jgi:hypothetical protein
MCSEGRKSAACPYISVKSANSARRLTEEIDEEEQIKETFAYFGRAVYVANVVETGLAHVLMQVEFMTAVREEFIQNKGKDFNRKKYEADFDAYMDKQHGKMMGELTKRVNDSTEFDEKLKARIVAAKDRRNYLVHNFWRDVAVEFSTIEGRKKLIEGLANDAEVFEKLDNDIRDATKPVRKRLGIKEEQLDEAVEQKMAELKAGLTLE